MIQSQQTSSYFPILLMSRMKASLLTKLGTGTMGVLLGMSQGGVANLMEVFILMDLEMQLLYPKLKISTRGQRSQFPYGLTVQMIFRTIQLHIRFPMCYLHKPALTLMTI